MKSYILKKDELFSEKINRVMASIFPNNFIELWKNSSIILVGNAIRDSFEVREINHFDFFCFHPDIFDMCKNILSHAEFAIYKEEDEIIAFEKNNLRIYITLDRRAKNVIDILENFGFSVDKIAYYKETLIMHKRFLQDLKNKHLVYLGSRDPKRNFTRQKMLREQGYTITKTDLDLIERDIDRVEY
jgi:hypothetical protein